MLYQHFPGKLDLYLALLDPSCDTIIDNCRAALASTDDNKLRVAATMDVFYDYVAGASGAFRLVFESDLTNEPAVRERVDRVTTECAEMIAEVIHEDTGLPGEQSRLLAVSLVGMAQVSARFWLDTRPAGSRRRPTPPPSSPGWPGAASAATPAPTSSPAPPTAAHPSGTRAHRRTSVEVKIGVQHAARELVVETDESAEDVEKPVAEARRRPSGVLALTDSKGRRVIVPADKLAYVEIGGGVAGQVGFRS